MKAFLTAGAAAWTKARDAQGSRRGRLSLEAIRLESFDRTCAKLKRLAPRDQRALVILKGRPLNSKALRDPFDALSD